MPNPSSLKRKLWAVSKAAIWGAVVSDAIVLLITQGVGGAYLGILLLFPSESLYHYLLHPEPTHLEPLSAALVINALLGAIVFGMFSALRQFVLKAPYEK